MTGSRVLQPQHPWGRTNAKTKLEDGHPAIIPHAQKKHDVYSCLYRQCMVKRVEKVLVEVSSVCLLKVALIDGAECGS